MKNIDIASVQKRRYETYEKEKDNLIVTKIEGGYSVSNLNKASTYNVMKDVDGVITCTCKDFSNFKGTIRCKHIITVGKKAVKASNTVIKVESQINKNKEEEINVNTNENKSANNNPIISGKEDITKLQVILTRPFPQEIIKYRKGFNNKQLAYVETVHYINRLNEAFNYQWDWQVINYTVTDDQVYCQGRLSIEINGKPINKESFGGKDITFIDIYDKVTRKATGRKALSIADDLKSASSDALKKAASLLGIGLHLYISQQKLPYPSNVKTGEGKIPDAPYNNTSSTVAPTTAHVGSSGKYIGGNGKSGNNGNNGNGGNGKTDINQIIKRW